MALRRGARWLKNKAEGAGGNIFPGTKPGMRPSSKPNIVSERAQKVERLRSEGSLHQVGNVGNVFEGGAAQTVMTNKAARSRGVGQAGANPIDVNNIMRQQTGAYGNLSGAIGNQQNPVQGGAWRRLGKIEAWKKQLELRLRFCRLSYGRCCYWPSN